MTYLYRRHEPVRYNAHAQEHVDECYKVNNGSCHFISYRGVLRVPDRQHHSCNQKKRKRWKKVKSFFSNITGNIWLQQCCVIILRLSNPIKPATVSMLWKPQRQHNLIKDYCKWEIFYMVPFVLLKLSGTAKVNESMKTYPKVINVLDLWH